MGRIGRLLFRRLLQEGKHQLVAVNDTMDGDNLAYLLSHDSLAGRPQEPVTATNAGLACHGLTIKSFRQADPLALPWAALDVDVVVECSGRFTDAEGTGKHLQAGAKKVLLSTTGSGGIPLLVYGHNHEEVGDAKLISPGGCMTNCTTHLLHLLSPFAIEAAHIHVLHSYTSRQSLVDGPHAQWRRGRAAAVSVVPVEINLHESLELLLPQLTGKLAALSSRVPVAGGAMADITLSLETPVNREAINTLFREAAAGPYKGIIGYTDDPLVSADILGDTRSAVLDGTLTSVTGNLVKIIAWFDNEYGFTSRLLDWLDYL